MAESATAAVVTWLTDVCPGWTRFPYPAPTLVYRVFSHDGTLLYIGSTIDLEGRFVRHSTHSGWFREVRLITIEQHPALEAARAAEDAAIVAEDPKYNIAGTPRDHRLRANRPG